MKIEDFIGTWKSKEFPNYHFDDGIQITLHISGSKIGTLWILNKEKKSITLVEGEISFNLIKNDKFELVFDGVAIDEKFLIISARMYMPMNPPSFLINVPDFGERYFQKLV